MNTHTDAEISKGREKEKRNERKKHIINLKRTKKESKYQNIKTHRLQIPSWKTYKKKRKIIKTRKRVTDTKSHKNIKQSQTRKGEVEKQQNPRITPSNQKITNIEKSRTKKEKDERTRSKDYVTDLKRRKYKNIQRKVNKKEAKTEDRITNRIPTVTNTRNPKRNRYDGQKEGKPGTISPLPNYVRRGPTLMREIYPQRDYYSSTTNSRRHMCVYSLERTPNETRLRPKRRCIATLFRRRQRLPAGFVHETAGSSIYRYRERDGST